MSRARHPYHPIIYVRGFAASQSAIDEAVADPYMGFNAGSTKMRQGGTGNFQRYYFESPIVRLAAEHNYHGVVVDGEDIITSEKTGTKIPYQTVVIYRYYEAAASELGTGSTPSIPEFAQGLSRLILEVRDKMCANEENNLSPEQFRVYLVAHSMGGLICRSFLQNTENGSDEARKSVDKLFTYATPHNGIDLRIVQNIPSWFSFGDVNNFSRKNIARFLDLDNTSQSKKISDVSEVRNFPVERIFNLIGTNPADYSAAAGISAWAAGEASDGLVRIENASTYGVNAEKEIIRSPRAYVHRSHSGHYGIVNSEEGYQNLTRFLFGRFQAEGYLDIDDISLPIELQKKHEAGKKVFASYQFEVSVSVRGCHWELTRRETRENSAIFRSYDQLFPGEERTERPADRSMSPHLFTVFLDPKKSEKSSNSVAFAVKLRVLVPDYRVDGILFLDRHYEGGAIYDKFIIIEATRDEQALGGWRFKYGFSENNPNKPGVKVQTYAVDNESIGFDIAIEQKTNPGLKGKLRIVAKNWNHWG